MIKSVVGIEKIHITQSMLQKITAAMYAIWTNWMIRHLKHSRRKVIPTDQNCQSKV